MTTYTNLDYLKELTDDDDDLIAESLKRYLKTSPESLGKLLVATKERSWQAIHNSAHSLFSTTQIVGLTMIAQPLKDIQNIATDNKDIEVIEREVAYVKEVVESSQEEIKQHLTQYEH